MSPGAADQLIVVSAVTVGGAYAYLVYKGTPPSSVGEFATAFGVIYFTLSLIATFSPGLGGAFALLVMAADLLANLPALTSAVGQDVPGIAATSSAGGKNATTSAGQDSRPSATNTTQPSQLMNTGETTTR